MLKRNYSVGVAGLLSLLFALVVPLSASATETCPSATFAGGTGTSSDAYRISNAEQFLEMSQCTGEYTHFEIANDIDFSDSTNKAFWESSVQGVAVFNGVLNGNDHVLSNLVITKSITRSGISGSALFREVVGTAERPAKIQNLTINKLSIETDSDPNHAGTIGKAENAVEIEGVNLSDISISALATAQGLLVGDYQGISGTSLKIRKSNVEGSLSCEFQGILLRCGAAIGYAAVAHSIHVFRSNFRLSVLEATANPTATYIGGLIGMYQPNISESLLTVSESVFRIDDPNESVTEGTGGLIGRFDSEKSTHEVTLERLSFLGDVPEAEKNAAMIGLLLNKVEGTRIRLNDAVFGSNVKTASSDRDLLIGEISTGDVSRSINRVFNGTNLVEGVDFTDSGNQITDLPDDQKSIPSSYSGFSVTNNLAGKADWYVQGADGQPALTDGYAVPKSVADLGLLGNRYFFEPNGGSGTRVGKIGTGTSDAAEVIANPFTRDGFNFAGWNTLSNTQGTDYASGAVYTGSDGDQLFAKWTQVQPAPAPPVFRPYFGPISRPYSGIPVMAGQEATISGSRLNSVTRVFSDETELEIISATNSSLVVLVPQNFSGVMDITLDWANGGDSGKYSIPGALDVTAVEKQFEEQVAEPISQVGQKVNAGSFKGYVAVYALGHEGSRLSAKIGKDWIVIPSIPSRDNNLYRVTDFTGAGVDIRVRIYIDRVLMETIPLTTK